MSFFSGFDRHMDLMYKVSGAVGVDLGAAVADQRLTAPELRAMAIRCKGCKEEAACWAFLDEHDGEADAPPSFCRNRDTLNRLAAG